MSVINPDINISVPDERDFDIIKKHIAEFELDGRDVHKNQFLVAKGNNEVFGFARIRIHDGCDEYCTLGVIERMRGRGIAGEITKAIIKASTQPLYLACIIPAYFEPYGFEISNTLPQQMQDKLNYCNDALPVKEQYVVMKYLGNLN